MSDIAQRHAELCRAELDEMDFFEGTVRREACIRRHIEEATEELEAENARLQKLLAEKEAERD